MKTLVRIQNHSNNSYNFITAQVLVKPFKNSDTIDVIGEFTFQQTKGESDWYGLSFKVEGDNPNHFSKMASLIRFITKNSYHDSQPDEIFNIIGAVRYRVYENIFIEESKEGQYIYKVMTKHNTLHSYIIAKNGEEAKKTQKKRGLEDSSLEYYCEIIF